VPALADLALRTWTDAFGESTADLEQTRSEAYFAQALREKVVLVAEARGALVGYVQIGDVEIPEVEAQPRDQALQRLYVETDLQGSGIGRALLQAALRHPRLANAARVFLQVWEANERAVRLYESVGFERAGTTRFAIGAEEMEDLIMVLDRH
jgi:ribosomal protein S18 acetylase RimI-like enzyme